MHVPPIPVTVESAFTSPSSDFDSRSSSRSANDGADPFEDTLDSLLAESEAPPEEAASTDKADVQDDVEVEGEGNVASENEVEVETNSESENEGESEVPVAIELPKDTFMMAATSNDHLMATATNESSVDSTLESTLSGVIGESQTNDAVAGLAAPAVIDASQSVQPAAASANPLIENNAARLAQPVSPGFVRESYQRLQLDGDITSTADTSTVLGATNGDPIASDPSAAAVASASQVEALAATELNPVSDTEPMSTNVLQESAEGEIVLPLNANPETALSDVESESAPSRVDSLQSTTGEAIPPELMSDPGSDAQSDLPGESNLSSDDMLAEINATSNDAINTANAATISVRGNSNVNATSNAGTVTLETAELIATQVGEHVIDARQSMENGRATLEVKLNPPELGKLTIELHEDNDLLTARLIVAEKATLETMKSTLPDLMRSLAESGVDVTDMQLESSSQERDAPSEQDNDASWDASDATTESPLSLGANRFTRNSGVNVLA